MTEEKQWQLVGVKMRIISDRDLLFLDSCRPCVISCPSLFSPISVPELPCLLQVWFLCWILPFFLLPLLTHAEYWTFSRDNFYSYILYSNLLQWKVNPVESFCQFFFQSSTVITDYLKKQLMKSCFIRPDHLCFDYSIACHLSTQGSAAEDNRQVYIKKLKPTLGYTAKLSASCSSASCSF